MFQLKKKLFLFTIIKILEGFEYKFMKYTIIGDHRDYFQKNHAIEFEELLTQSQLSDLDESIDEVLAGRLQIAQKNLAAQTPHSLFMAGRDLWRTHISIRKIVTSARLAHIASELIEIKPLRLGYDQFFSGGSLRWTYGQENHPYSQLLSEVHSLADISCLQGVLCGLMLCLSFSHEGQSIQLPKDAEAPLNIFCSKPGSGVYFDPSSPIDFSQLTHRKGDRYLLITYVQPSSVYLLKENDIHTHALKSVGYVFGDKLKEKLNPIVFR